MHFSLIKHLKRSGFALGVCLALIAPLLTPLNAHAHRPFIVATSTLLNSAPAWVSFDAATATDIFFFDHVAMSLNNLVITAADGSQAQAENLHTGKLRSNFD